MERVASGFGDHTDLSARTRTELSGVVVGIHPEFLNVFDAALKAEWRHKLAAHVSGTGIDNRGSLDTVEANGILFHGAPVKADIAERSGACVLRARRLQIELGQLTAVVGQFVEFTQIDIGAHRGGAGVDRDHTARFHIHGRAEVCGLQREVDIEPLTDSELNPFGLRRCKARQRRRKRIHRRPQRRHNVGALVAGNSCPLFARTVILDRYRHAGDERSTGIFNISCDTSLIGLAKRNCRQGDDQ